MKMKKTMLGSLFMFLLAPLMAQDFGLSFSYFLPKNGYFSTPVSPFSIRGLGKDLNRFLAIETGGSLYLMPGLNLKNLPFESKRPLVGPNLTLLIPAELVFQLRGNRVEFDVKGGGFFFYPFWNKINYGNFDRALREYEQWTVVNSDLSFRSKPGFGYHGGAELTVYVTGQVGVSLEANYLAGEAGFPLSGTYTGGSGALETKSLDERYQDAKLDFTGYEFSIGLIFSSGGGGGAKRPPQRRRRR